MPTIPHHPPVVTVSVPDAPNTADLAPPRAHVSYLEPHPDHGIWTSPPRCLPTRAAAEAYRDAVTALAGPDARARRTWTVGPCTCGGAR